jgi:hypothetical protein
VLRLIEKEYKVLLIVIELSAKVEIGATALTTNSTPDRKEEVNKKSLLLTKAVFY